jgi:hypothetical protein
MSQFIKTVPLPPLDQNFGIGTRIHQALDRVAVLRVMACVYGPQGMGKSFKVEDSRRWYEEKERRLIAGDESFTPQGVRVLRNLWDCSRADTLAAIQRAARSNRTTVPVSARDRGRRQPPDEQLANVCEELLRRNIVALILDEAEKAPPEVFMALRDVAATSADIQRSRVDEHLRATPLGVGVLIVGTSDTDGVVRQLSEFGQRIVSTDTLPLLSIADATSALGRWLPGTAQLTGDDKRRFLSLARVNVCRDRPTVLRRVWSVVYYYARRLETDGRLKGVTSWDGVPIDLELLKAIADDDLPPDVGAAPRPRGA